MGFAGVVLIKKDINASASTRGAWDAIHIIEVVPDSAGSKNFSYKLTSTVMLRLQTSDPEKIGSLDLGGSLTRQVRLFVLFWRHCGRRH